MSPPCRNVKNLLQVLATWDAYGKETAATVVTTTDLDAACDMQFPWQLVPTANGALAAQRHHALRYRKSSAQLDRTVEEASILRNEVVRTFAWLEERMAAVEARCIAIDALAAPLHVRDETADAAGNVLLSEGVARAFGTATAPGGGVADSSENGAGAAARLPQRHAGEDGGAIAGGHTDSTALPLSREAQPSAAPLGIQQGGGSSSAGGVEVGREAAGRLYGQNERRLAAGQLALLRRIQKRLSFMRADADRQLRSFMPLPPL